MTQITHDGERTRLHSPTAMPKACAFLWNPNMLMQMNCRGYATAQFMQPEPAKYSHGPALEARTFMQPEQPYYAHHPGRFFYLKCEEGGEIFSVPYEPVRAKPDSFVFDAGPGDLRWHIRYGDLEVHLKLTLGFPEAVELWEFSVRNTGQRPRKLSIYPYFSVGYMSWMNQSGEYRADLGALVCSSVTPYQKVDDYFRMTHFRDKTFLAANCPPDGWEASAQHFEGEGGLHHPDGLKEERLRCGDARYELPAAIMQYRTTLDPGASQSWRFVFGPARDDAEIQTLAQQYLDQDRLAENHTQIQNYLEPAQGCLEQNTGDEAFDHFCNHWLPRQAFYHGEVNRLTTDPQTRNYLQDHMGMSFFKPDTARAALLTALAQQQRNGSMPDGILIHPEAELKYINQVPHMDHCVWLPLMLETYLNETGDAALLEEPVAFADDATPLPVWQHIDLALNWLWQSRDERGLNYIAQGDWCDPMNMVGYKGKGVSAWLTLASGYAHRVWAKICDDWGMSAKVAGLSKRQKDFNDAVNRHCWDGQWYARGITDDGVTFGTHKDEAGRIFLNPQAWALLSNAANETQRKALIHAVTEQLHTPYGPMLLAPSFQAMREDVGRVTQKHPGTAENGSVYNHASAFYIHALYEVGEGDRAWELLRAMVPGPDDYLRRGQMPLYVPNYYRGAYHQFPDHAGRSSHLFNTGSAAWMYRILIEDLFGLKGQRGRLHIKPQLPSHWQQAEVVRVFREATVEVHYTRGANPGIWLDDEACTQPCLPDLEAGRTYQVRVVLAEQ